MPTFEFNKTPFDPEKTSDRHLSDRYCSDRPPIGGAGKDLCASEVKGHAFDRLRDECVIALKVYDSCRNQECLTNNELGPARAAEDTCVDGFMIRCGDVIVPPCSAASVSIDCLVLRRVLIVDKQPCQFNSGFWDIDLKYVFEYRLNFREANGCPLDPIMANSICNRRVTLFGSMGGGAVVATDLFGDVMSDNSDCAPIVFVDAKPLALAAELKYRKCHHHGKCDCECEGDDEADCIHVAIGLFSIIKLCRLVALTVQSKGFCKPPEGEEICPLNPCDYFNDMCFPMDIFSPPQKPEFEAGVSWCIPKEYEDACGCE